MKDLTRWNRPGLSRFRYLDGNAVLWLEEMRRSLLERFPSSGWAAVQDSAPAEETDVERLTRLEFQYAGAERGDMLWEMTRTLSRACHVLTEHLDAYANERHLRTATQWDNVRRLVEMIDYHPSPPASASTSLILKAGEGQSGTVGAGFKVKHSPPDGGAAVVFETLEDIDVDVALDALHLAGWNRSSDTLGGAAPWIATSDMLDRLSAGQVVIVDAGDGRAEADRIRRIDAETGGLTLAGSVWASFGRADARLHARPEQIRKPQLNGPDVVAAEAGHGLVKSVVVAWQEDGCTWRFGEVMEANADSLRLGSGALPAAGTDVYRMSIIGRGASGLLFPSMSDLRVAAYLSSGSYTRIVPGSSDYSTETRGFDVDGDGADETFAYSVLSSAMAGVERISVVSSEATPIRLGAGAGAEAEGDLVFLGGPGSLSGGDQVAVEDQFGVLHALQVDVVDEQEDRFTVTFVDDAALAGAGVVRLYGPFLYEIEPEGYDYNGTELSGDSSSRLELALDPAAWPPLLAKGRRLVIEQAVSGSDVNVNGVSATVAKVEGNTITIAPPLAADAGFTKGNTVIRANVVLVGHGETRPARVLGSGDATLANQRFDFENEGVTFVSDTTMSAGVRADVVISVGDRSWVQVSRLNDSGPGDPHYEVELTADGHLRIGFGDGEHGRLLPTGTSNVRISWRKGTGLLGNLRAGSLVKPVKPHRLLDAVEQPIAATGGSDVEGTASLRENAPASLLTLERAVSISDFKYLATSHSSVWQANAFLRNSGPSRREHVEVVVVPSGGGELGQLYNTLAAHLEAHALPGVRVSVSGYEGLVVELRVTVRVKSAEYDADKVVADVGAALLEAFSLQKRELGQSLHRAEVFEVVERVDGVENSDCELLPLDSSQSKNPIREVVSASGTIKGLVPGPTQVIHLESTGAGMVIDSAAHSL